MSIEQWLSSATTQLEAGGIETARLDALVLLEDILNTNRAQLLAYPDHEVSSAVLSVLNKQLAQRAEHMPLAYIRGHSEFYGREFIVSRDVLVPRPESEALIDLLLHFVATEPELALRYTSSSDEAGPPPADRPKKRLTSKAQFGLTLADVGTGSGALGITAALELPKLTVELLEIDPKALKIAKANVINHTTGILVKQTDLLTASSNDYDILICNLPYVPDAYQINEAAGYEPYLALFGGPDGLNVYRTLFQQVSKLQKRPLLILTESLPAQHDNLVALAAEIGYEQRAEHDFAQAFCPK
jgi:release factor glutamine methyltransferase